MKVLSRVEYCIDREKLKKKEKKVEKDVIYTRVGNNMVAGGF